VRTAVSLLDQQRAVSLFLFHLFCFCFFAFGWAAEETTQREAMRGDSHCSQLSHFVTPHCAALAHWLQVQPQRLFAVVLCLSLLPLRPPACRSWPVADQIHVPARSALLLAAARPSRGKWAAQLEPQDVGRRRLLRCGHSPSD
jgi:hypothetical protein